MDHSISSRQSDVIIDDVGWGGEDHDRYSQVLGHLGRGQGKVKTICSKTSLKRQDVSGHSKIDKKKIQ